MRIAHTADLHIGFRQFDKTVGLRNTRELDVEASVAALVDGLISVRPDAIIVGGDVFHQRRPSNDAILFAFAQFSRLAKALPECPIVVAGGNHDVPLTLESAVILNLLKPLGIHVADRQAVWFRFPERGLSVFAVPDAPGMVRPPLEPDPEARYSVLCLHGEVQGMAGLYGDRAVASIALDDIAPARWSYCGLGHWHVHQEIAPNCFYSGSADYTSSNPWGELKAEAASGLTGKGFVEHDLDTGVHTFHPLPSSRDHLDLVLSADGLSPAELNVAIRELLEDKWPDGTVCRLILTECTRDQWGALDKAIVREYKTRSLNFSMSYKPPEIVRVGSRIGTLRRAQSLDEITATFLARRFAENMPADLSLEAITKLSAGYLAKAQGDDPELIPKLEQSVAATEAA